MRRTGCGPMRWVVFVVVGCAAACQAIVGGRDGGATDTGSGELDGGVVDSGFVDTSTDTGTGEPDGPDGGRDADTESDDSGIDTGTCEPDGCGSRICGEWPDGCGDWIDCGSCGGVADRCVDGGCVDDCASFECGPSPILGVECGPCAGDRPRCDVDNGTCHECLTDEDCRDGGVAPSPVGLCAPGRVCTCWVENGAPRGGCGGDNECPEGYRCARDWDDGFDAHAVCLRTCDGGVGDGIECEIRAPATELVWAPATTCFARARWREDCGGADAECGLFKEGKCDDLQCTYRCSGDLDCPGECAEVGDVCER